MKYQVKRNTKLILENTKGQYKYNEIFRYIVRYEAMLKTPCKNEQTELKIKIRIMYCLFGRHFTLSKIKSCYTKQIFRSIWTDGIQLWGCI